MAGDGVMEFGDWIIMDALKRNTCVKVPEFPDELTCLKLDESDASVEWRVYVPKGSECSECKERQGYYMDAETVQRQQERIAELERMLEHDRLGLICYENEVDRRDALIRDMWEDLAGLQGGYEELGYKTSLPEFAERMHEFGIEVDE